MSISTRIPDCTLLNSSVWIPWAVLNIFHEHSCTYSMRISDNVPYAFLIKFREYFWLYSINSFWLCPFIIFHHHFWTYSMKMMNILNYISRKFVIIIIVIISYSANITIHISILHTFYAAWVFLILFHENLCLYFMSVSMCIPDCVQWPLLVVFQDHFWSYSSYISDHIPRTFLIIFHVHFWSYSMSISEHFHIPWLLIIFHGRFKISWSFLSIIHELFWSYSPYISDHIPVHFWSYSPYISDHIPWAFLIIVRDHV